MILCKGLKHVAFLFFFYGLVDGGCIVPIVAGGSLFQLKLFSNNADTLSFQLHM